MDKCEIGFFIKCPQPEMIEACGVAGMDFVVIDMEHTPLGPRDLYPLILAAERRNIKTTVRIPAKLDMYFKWCRDLNVTDIQVPHVETADDAKYAMYHTYFSPAGGRGLCRFVRAADFSGKTKDEYLEYANDSNSLILQIEGTNALPNIEDIINTIDENVSLFVGPYDLSQAMGCPGDIWNKSVVKEMKRIITLCQNKGIKVGTFTDSTKGIKFWKDCGVSFIQYASDLNVFINAARDIKKLV